MDISILAWDEVKDYIGPGQYPKLYMNPTKNLIDPKLYTIPTKNLIELKFYMNPTKNLIDPKLYMIPTKNLIELKLYTNKQRINFQGMHHFNK